MLAVPTIRTTLWLFLRPLSYKHAHDISLLYGTCHGSPTCRGRQHGVSSSRHLKQKNFIILQLHIFILLFTSYLLLLFAAYVILINLKKYILQFLTPGWRCIFTIITVSNFCHLPHHHLMINYLLLRLLFIIYD